MSYLKLFRNGFQFCVLVVRLSSLIKIRALNQIETKIAMSNFLGDTQMNSTQAVLIAFKIFVKISPSCQFLYDRVIFYASQVVDKNLILHLIYGFTLIDILDQK